VQVTGGAKAGVHLRAHAIIVPFNSPSSPPMTDSYLAVLKAAYDYEPQSDDEIAIKENALLFLLEKTDEECVRAVSLSPAWTK
jgi:hypothetical protein